MFRSIRRNNTRVILALLAIALIMTVPVSAHIVPPQEYHPMAEAHRRMTFMLNLNPVLWATVARDSNTIASELSLVAQVDANAYTAAVGQLLGAVYAPDVPSTTEPSLRNSTARRVYELSTEAVAEALVLHIEVARNDVYDYEIASKAFEAARQIWESFAFEVQATDPAMFNRLGKAWLECSGALGSPGVLGVGAVRPDSEIFASESQKIVDYIKTNFGSGYSAPESGRLLPLPTRSDSFDAAAVVPVKLPPGTNTNKQLPRPRQVLRMAELGVDEGETPLIALGDMAFDSPYIFGDPTRALQLSCNSCHNKGVTNPQFEIPGLSSRPGGVDVSNNFLAPHANNGLFDPVDIPDLRGIRFTAPYGRNGRFASLREFVRNGIMHEFKGKEPDPVLLDAMIAYMNEFEFLPNPYLNHDGTLNDTASDEAARGETIFNRPFVQMNNRSCATCHVPSTQFLDGKRHDIGSVHGMRAYSADGALDTPTLLSSLTTQPYFHDGSLPTLGAVVDWFNEQHALGLDEGAKTDLTAYLETVGYGEDAYEDTLYTLEAEMEEFSFFLSSHDYTVEIDRPELGAIIFETIAAEIRAHKWDVQDQSYLSVLEDMAVLMDAAYTANRKGNGAEVAMHIENYRALYAANKEHLK